MSEWSGSPIFMDIQNIIHTKGTEISRLNKYFLKLHFLKRINRVYIICEERMRKNRIYSETGYYHVVVRGVNKQNIFFDNEDRKLFINLIKKYCKRLNVKVHAYCLMDNHVHLELEDMEYNISVFMQSICSVYARMFNRKYDRIGHLFQSRFASEVINSNSYFLTVFRYILNNPIKAGICKGLDYEWSSFKYLWRKKSFIEKRFILDMFENKRLFFQYLLQEKNEVCLEIELRPSEKKEETVTLIKRLLCSDNPIIAPDLPKKVIVEKIRVLKKAKISFRMISRITGISMNIVQSA